MFLEHNGVKLYYEDRGKGPKSIIFLHGLMMTHDVWKNQAEVFSKDFRVVTPDLRGFGESDKPGSPYTFEIFSEDILALIDELELVKPSLVGWSLGASIGMTYAAKYPETLSRLVLVDGTPLFVATGDFPHAVPPEAADELVQGLLEDFASGARHFVELMFPEPDVEDVKDFVYGMTQKSPVGSVLNCLQNVGGVDLRGALPEIQLPTLILSGGQDRVCMPEASRYMHNKIGDSRLHIFPGKGHAPFLTDVNDFNEALKAFLTV